MSDEIVHRIGVLAAETAVEVAWVQWSSLTGAAAIPTNQRPVWTIVDPEALILVSLAVRERERRLNDLLAGLAATGSSLLSIRRLKALAMDYPEPVREQVSDFARYAADAGDRQWRIHAADSVDARSFKPRKKEIGPLRLTEGPGIMLRIRAGIGVGAKADLLTFLLGLRGASAELKVITLATGYSNRAMRTAADEMALARFVHEVKGPPSAYRVEPEAWGQVLGIQRHGAGPTLAPSMPRWRFWSVVFAFLTAVIHWERQAKESNWSAYVASSRARDLIDEHGRLLRYTDAGGIDTGESRGAEYLAAFQGVVERISLWARDALYE